MILSRHLLSTNRIGIVWAGHSWGQPLRGTEVAPEKVIPRLKETIFKKYNRSIEINEYKNAHNRIRTLEQLSPYKEELSEHKKTKLLNFVCRNNEKSYYEKSISLNSSNEEPENSDNSENSEKSNKDPENSITTNSTVNLNLPLFNGKFSQLVADDVEKSCQENDLTFIIGGDHSITVGSCEGHFRNYKNNDDQILVFIDAHADLNTDKTSPSGNMHGMPVAFLLNEFKTEGSKTGLEWTNSNLKAKNLFYIGLRCVDPGEEVALKKFDVKRIYANDFIKMTLSEKRDCVDDLLDKLRGDKTEILPIHLSFCIDSLEPHLAPATGTVEPNGLSLKDVFMVIDRLKSKRFKIRCLDLVEINPVPENYPLDRSVTEKDVETTIGSGVQVVEKVFNTYL